MILFFVLVGAKSRWDFKQFPPLGKGLKDGMVVIIATIKNIQMNRYVFGSEMIPFCFIITDIKRVQKLIKTEIVPLNDKISGERARTLKIYLLYSLIG